MAIRRSVDRGEKRLYVVVAATVQVAAKTTVQPIGRQAAQACHAVGRFRWFQGFSYGTSAGDSATAKFVGSNAGITTIVLQCRDSAELAHVESLLVKKKINLFNFLDENPEYGGDLHQAVTAFCTEPVYKDQVGEILDYLPLFGCGGKQ